jgi:hypothetical protein
LQPTQPHYHIYPAPRSAADVIQVLSEAGPNAQVVMSVLRHGWALECVPFPDAEEALTNELSFRASLLRIAGSVSRALGEPASCHNPLCFENALTRLRDDQSPQP